MRLWSRCQPGLQASGTGGSTSKLTGVVVNRPVFLAGWWSEASVPIHVRPTVDCLRVLMTWQLASSKANEGERKRWVGGERERQGGRTTFL